MTVGKILEVKENDWNGLTRTIFTVEEDGAKAYILTQDKNRPTEGQKLEGTFKIDRAGQRKFTRDTENSGNFQSDSTQPQWKTNSPRKEVNTESMYRCNALNNAVARSAVSDTDTIVAVAQRFYDWLNGKLDVKKEAQTDQVDRPPVEMMVDQGDYAKTEYPEDIDLEDIPF